MSCSHDWAKKPINSVQTFAEAVNVYIKEYVRRYQNDAIPKKYAMQIRRKLVSHGICTDLTDD